MQSLHRERAAARHGDQGVRRRLVLFDIDGTLLLSGGAGKRAILAAIADVAGIEGEALHGVRFDGKTDPQIVTELFEAAGTPLGGPERIDLILERYLVHLESDLTTNTHLATVMPGIHPLLEALGSDPGVVVGLLTGNIARGATIKLAAAGIPSGQFQVGAYGSDHAVRSSLPPIAAERAMPLFGRVPRGAEVVIIGDTPADVTCGQSLGATSIGVATGHYTVDALADAGAHWVFSDLGDTERVHSAILAERS